LHSAFTNYPTYNIQRNVTQQHFNNRESPVISLGVNCNASTQLNVEFVDTQGDEKLALNALLTKTQLNQPDLIIGPLTSKEAVPVALVASVQQVPIIAYSATTQKLDDSAK
jgi:ABC-type branched-subunit amino acid transport system substrate-binding protein